MDFSAAYKALCMKAEEIQKKWAPAKGDIYLLPHENGKLHFWTEGTDSAFFRQGFAILRKGKIITLQRRTWLPRHNQLMELAQIPGISFQDMTYRFHRWSKERLPQTSGVKDKKNPKNLPAIEEAWLSFIMETHFEKHWSGKDWISFK